jgi:hypothetical protein
MQSIDYSTEYHINTVIHTKLRSMDWPQGELKLLTHFAYLVNSNETPAGFKEYGCFYSPSLGVVASREIVNDDHLHADPGDSAIMVKPAATLNDAIALAYKWYKKIEKDRGTFTTPADSPSPSTPVGAGKRGRPKVVTPQPALN